MKITIGSFELELSVRDKQLGHKSPSRNDAIQFLKELAVLLHSAAKWEFKKGNKFTAESAKSWGNDITEQLRENKKYEVGKRKEL